MSALSDVQELYGAARGVWRASQAHIVTHLALAMIVFGVCKAKLPAITVNAPRVDDILHNSWFLLAKETGIVYAVLLIPIVLLAAYSEALRRIGETLVGILRLAIPARPGPPPRSLNSFTLEPLALSLGRDDFGMGDLFDEAGRRLEVYRSRKGEEWEAYDSSLRGLTRNSMAYLSDALAFILAWTVLYAWRPRAAFVEVNPGCFWPVLLILIGAAWLLWLRVWRTLALVPVLRLLTVSAMVRADPELSAAMSPPQEKRERVQARIEELLHEEERRERTKPSLSRYLASRGLWRVRQEADPGRDRQSRGRPFPNLYERGGSFSRDEKLNATYDRAWPGRYGAYLYYRIHRHLQNLGTLVRHVARYVLTGAP